MKGKHISRLDCAAPAEQMIHRVLKAQVKTMCGQRKEALDWSDPEGVHHMRVASRRLRSSIRDFEPHRRKGALPIAKLRAIAKSLGAVRDEDVAIAALEKLALKAHGKAAQGIELLTEERRQQREEARAALEKAISSSAIKSFRDEFERKLESVATTRRKSSASQSGSAVTTFGSISAPVINARLKELQKAGPDIYSPFQVKELHELRILAKRLRYSIELSSTCGPDEMISMAKEIAQLQTSLGELHDCDVWIEDLGARLKKLQKRNENDRETTVRRTGYTWLLKHFAKVRHSHYQDALNRWQQWETDGFLDNVALLIKSP
ncbi:MAG: CHAD domain-containing protein [Pyrinomonadaceae bacterium]